MKYRVAICVLCFLLLFSFNGCAKTDKPKETEPIGTVETSGDATIGEEEEGETKSTDETAGSVPESNEEDHPEVQLGTTERPSTPPNTEGESVIGQDKFASGVVQGPVPETQPTESTGQGKDTKNEGPVLSVSPRPTDTPTKNP